MERCNMGWEGNINVIKMLIYYKIQFNASSAYIPKGLLQNLKIWAYNLSRKENVEERPKNFWKNKSLPFKILKCTPESRSITMHVFSIRRREIHDVADKIRLPCG